MSHSMVTLRAKAKSSNSLICLLMGLRGRVTTIELRNENSVVGCIESCDEKMNITLTDAKFSTLSGATGEFEFFYIQGRNIRFVHIPQEVNVVNTMKAELRHIHGKHRRDFKVSGTGTKSERDIERNKQKRKQLKDQKMFFSMFLDKHG